MSRNDEFKTPFTNKTVDLRRFAYDLFVYSLSKFKVPIEFVCQPQHPENDYGVYHLCPIIFRSIIKYQMEHRYALYEIFNSELEANDLEIYDRISYVCQIATNKLMNYTNLCIFDKVEISLAVVCELILFLHSKNKKLYLNELSGLWCQWINVQRKSFEKNGGLTMMYLASVREGKDRADFLSAVGPDGKVADTGPVEQNVNLDSFFDDFIRYCKSYEDSVRNEELCRIFFELGSLKKLQITKTYAQSNLHGRNKEGRRNTPGRAAYSSRNSTPVPISKNDEYSGACGSVNPGLGIIPHEELLSVFGASASADATPPRESPRHRKGSSGHQRRQRTTSDLKSGSEPGIGASDSTDATLPRESRRHRKGSSGHQRRQGTTSDLLSCTKDGFGASTDATLPRESPSHRRGYSGDQRRQRTTSDLLASSEQCFSASASADATHPRESPKPFRGSSGHQTPSTTSSSHSGFEQDFGRLSLGFSGTKQSSKEKPSSLVDDVATLYQRVFGEIPKKPEQEDSDSDSTNEKRR